MSVLPALIAGGIRTADVIAPNLAGDLAYRSFFTTGPRMPVAEADIATHEAARRSTLRIRDLEIVAYEWGAGDEVVLLLHGWGGRASQFAPLVRELSAEGFRVASFDAPAHGSSAGRGTDIRDWLDLAAQLQRRYGPLHALIGHSFGALAALAAARSSTPARAVAAIAGAASPAAFVDRFASDLRLRAAARARMEARFRARMGVSGAEMIARYDAVRHPLPSETRLLVAHDRHDRRMPDTDSLRLHSAHGDRSRLLRTDGLGHTRILRADATMDAVLDLVTVRGDRPAGTGRNREGLRV